MKPYFKFGALHPTSPEERLRFNWLKFSEKDRALAEQARAARAARLEEKRALRAAGIVCTKVRTLHCIEVRGMRQIPEWAQSYRVRGLPKQQNALWTERRWVANDVYGELNGLGVTVSAHEAYRCPSCKRWVIGLDARDLARRVEDYRKLGASVAQPYQAGLIPPDCGVHCQSRAA